MIASPAFQRWAAAFPLTRPFVARDGARLFDLVSGFVYSQVLLACVELDLLRALSHGPETPGALARSRGVPDRRMETLCQAAAALGLMVRQRDGRFRLGRLGAAALGVPGLAAMIRHHRLFYDDLADPVRLLRGEAEPALAGYWSYVRGGVDGETACEYSRLMAASQRLVAEETLATVSLSGARHLADIGGGTGAFLAEVAPRYPRIALTLFDLPAVIDAAGPKLAEAELADRIRTVGGSFLEDPLPDGVDAISLVRVLYDHDDETVRTLLSRVYAALPPGGRLIVSEPMSGGAAPARAGDAYFGFYTMAMTTGTPRAPDRHAALLTKAGFAAVTKHRARQPFITSVVSARKPR